MNKSIDVISILKNNGVLVVFILICIILSIISPFFLSYANITNILRQTSIIGILAVGMTFVILTAGIDLSVGSILALSGMTCAIMLRDGASIAASSLAALAVGGGVGLVNGLLVTIGKITPFVVTLGMMSVARGVTLILSGGRPVSGFPGEFRDLGAGFFLGVPIPVIIFFAVTFVAWFILSHTKLGRYTYAIGGNEETVKLSGINAGLYKTLVYVILGICAGISALILTSRLNAAEAIAGTGYELNVIAAVVVGGTSLMGGRGGVIGTIIGALLIGVINNGMNLMGVSPYFQQVVRGSLIIAAVFLDRFREETK